MNTIDWSRIPANLLLNMEEFGRLLEIVKSYRDMCEEESTLSDLKLATHNVECKFPGYCETGDELQEELDICQRGLDVGNVLLTKLIAMKTYVID